MAEYTWFKDAVPEGLPVKQVYGIAFSDDNRVILRIEDGKYKLTGGKPEDTETYEETLKREYIEELNVELDDIHYLGYLLVDDHPDRYAQVRMIAKIREIHGCRADPDTGKTYGRELVPADRMKEYLNYSDCAGNEMIDDAIQLAGERYVVLPEKITGKDEKMMQDPTIRRVDEEDDAVGGFIHEEFTRYGEQNGVVLNYDEFCFIAEDSEGKIIGAVTGRAYYNEVHIGDLIVDESCRRSGLGRRLVGAVEDCYKGKGYDVITLTTFGFQAPEFYQKLGYKLEFVRTNKDPKLNKYFLKKEL